MVSLAARQSGNTLLLDVAAAGVDLTPGRWEYSRIAVYLDVQFSNPGLVTLLAGQEWSQPFPWGGDVSAYLGAGAVTVHGYPAAGSVAVASVEVRPCSDPGRIDESPCEGTARVGTNSVLRLHFNFVVGSVNFDGYRGPGFSFTATPMRMIYTPGNFGSPNVAPFAIAQQLQTAVNTSVPVTLTGDDLERDPITFAIATQPAHGRLQGLEPNIVYVPNQDFEGLDSFTYTVNDGTATSGAATVFVQVINPNGGGNTD